MFVNKLPRYEILSEDAVETLERGWKRIVSELGVEFLLPEAVELFAQAGMRTEGDNVWFDPDFINFHAVRPEKYRIGDLVLEQFQRGLARAELVNAGIVIAPDGRVPECLKPRPAPQAKELAGRVAASPPAESVPPT